MAANLNQKVVLPGTIQPKVFPNLAWDKNRQVRGDTQEREPLTVLMGLPSNPRYTDHNSPVYSLQLSANESGGLSRRQFSLSPYTLARNRFLEERTYTLA